MLHLFKPKDYRKINSLFVDMGFHSDDFKQFQIEQLVSNLKSRQEMFAFVLQIFRDTKLTPLKALKIALLCLQLVHSLKEKDLHGHIFQFLHELEVRINALQRAKRNLVVNQSSDLLSTSKEFINKAEEVVAMDFSSILLGKIVMPLIHFQEKILVSYELVYNRGSYSSANEEEIWSRMNLLRKILQIGGNIESMGRYYFKQSASAVICMMKIINYDIQFLYKRIYEYFRKKIVSIEIIFEEQRNSIEKIMNEQRIEEFLMMIEQLQLINEKLRVAYNGRYFVYHLAKINVYIPILFTSEEHIELMYKIKEYRKYQEKKSKSIEIKKRKAMESTEYVEEI